MDDGYLPDYYIRKKQRDRTYRVVWNVLALVAGSVAAVFLANFLWNNWGLSLKMRGKAAVNEEHANELNTLQTEERINDAIASQTQAVGDLADEQEPDAEGGSEPAATEAAESVPSSGLVADISDIEYSESFPLVAVSLEAGDGPGEQQRTSADNSAIAEITPAPEDRGPSTESTAVSTGDDEPELDKPAQKPAEDKDEEKQVISTKIYHVYAAEVTSRDEADDVVKKLADHGYQGTIIEQNPYFLIKVLQTRRGEEAHALIEKLKQLGFEPIPTVSNKT